ncbi:hypothetical protein [Yoonia sp.]|uniref:hypothetical protein n=1 Tax=Yoonia sp. TaxID=2212373 RepID=UPI0035C86A78
MPLKKLRLKLCFQRLYVAVDGRAMHAKGICGRADNAEARKQECGTKFCPMLRGLFVSIRRRRINAHRARIQNCSATPHHFAVDAQFEDLAGKRRGDLLDQRLDTAPADCARELPFHLAEAQP